MTSDQWSLSQKPPPQNRLLCLGRGLASESKTWSRVTVELVSDLITRVQLGHDRKQSASSSYWVEVAALVN
jgi:hypothetical protein